MTDVAPELRYSGLPPAVAFSFPATTAGIALVVGGGGLLAGWALEETTGAARARCVIGEGNVAGTVQNPIAPVILSADQSTRDYPTFGILFQRHLVVQVTAGTVAGALWVVTLTPTQLRDVINIASAS